jgi:hypothetical protein
MNSIKDGRMQDAGRSRHMAGIALAAWLLVYALGSLAIDTGSLLQYFFTVVLLIVAVKTTILAYRSYRSNG